MIKLNQVALIFETTLVSFGIISGFTQNYSAEAVSLNNTNLTCYEDGRNCVKTGNLGITITDKPPALNIKLTVNFSHGQDPVSITGIVISDGPTLVLPTPIGGSGQYLQLIDDKFGHGSLGEGHGTFTLSPLSKGSTTHNLVYGLNSVTRGDCNKNLETCTKINTTVSASYSFTTNPAMFSEFDNVTSRDKEPVPEPLTILGSATALGFGAFFKRKLKSSESSEKEIAKVG